MYLPFLWIKKKTSELLIKNKTILINFREFIESKNLNYCLENTKMADPNALQPTNDNNEVNFQQKKKN